MKYRSKKDWWLVGIARRARGACFVRLRPDAEARTKSGLKKGARSTLSACVFPHLKFTGSVGLSNAEGAFRGVENLCSRP